MIDGIHILVENLSCILTEFLSEKKIAAVTEHNPKELALGNAHGAVVKCLKSLPPDTTWTVWI